MKRLPAFFLFSFTFLLLAVPAQNLTVHDIMAEPSIAGMRVSGEKLSPDGTKVVYLWNSEGKMPRDLYLVSTSGGTAQIILRISDLPAPKRPQEKENKLDYGLTIRDDFVKERENQFGNFEWSPNSKKLAFSYGGDLYIFTLGEPKAKRFTKTTSGETNPRFLDNERIMYSLNGNIFILNTVDATTTQITKEANQQTFISVTNATPTKDGSLIAYVVSDGSKQRGLLVPNYLDEFVAAPPTRRGWSEQKVFVTPADGSRDTPFEIKLPKAEGVSNFGRLVWAADNRSLIIDRNDKDTKRRQLYYIHNVGSKDEQIILVTEETDEKWIAPLSAIVEPNPKDASQLIFCSEKDGYNHLYLAKLEAETRPVASVSDSNNRVQEGGDTLKSDVKIRQLTNGNWQVEWVNWTGENEITLSSTEHGTAERDIKSFKMNSDKSIEIQPNVRGIKGNFQLSDGDSPTLLFEYSRWNQPGELFAISPCEKCESPKAIQITGTVPEAFRRRAWNEPKFIDIPSRDGKQIKSKIYLPAGHNAKQKYPMVVFVHGAGYIQNVINGWNNYYREFMFNELLTQKGYVVLDIDYRGSAGYGRDWRTDVYDFLGGKDMDDHIDAIDFMVKNYAVNPAKVGVYGGSYGGFMAEMLVMRAPDKIAAAAALRPVSDWKNYYAANPSYTAQRLGFPEKNPEAYLRSSPIAYADKLERPLLILHGMNDDNVHVQDSVQMIEKLIRLGKTPYFEAMLYPSENHGFVRPESWTDEYERILAFFEKHLK